jgi:hypothetical protein
LKLTATGNLSRAVVDEMFLWSLSASAHDWLLRETLTRVCASPVIGVLESQWDFGSSAMEARILRPLVWFGLLESRTRAKLATEVVNRRLYRKTPLFDRFVKFDVQIEGPDIRINQGHGKEEHTLTGGEIMSESCSDTPIAEIPLR